MDGTSCGGGRRRGGTSCRGRKRRDFLFGAWRGGASCFGGLERRGFLCGPEAVPRTSCAGRGRGGTSFLILEPPAGTSGVTLLGAGLPLPGGAGLGSTSCPTCGDYREFLCSRLRPPRCQSRVGWGGACGGTPPWRRRCGGGVVAVATASRLTPCVTRHTPPHASPCHACHTLSHPVTPCRTRHTRSHVTCTPHPLTRVTPFTCHPIACLT